MYMAIVHPDDPALVNLVLWMGNGRVQAPARRRCHDKRSRILVETILRQKNRRGSYLVQEPGPAADEPVDEQKNCASEETRAADGLYAEIGIGRVEDGAADRGAEEQSDRHDGEHHPEPGPEVPEVLGDGGHHHRGQRDQAAREESVQEREDDDAGRGVDRDPAKGYHGRQTGRGYENVERTPVVRGKVRREATERRRGVEHGEEVEGQVLRRDPFLNRPRLDVAEEVVVAQEPDELRQAEERESDLLERRELEQTPLVLSGEPDAHDRDGHGARSQAHKGQGPRRPPESNLLLEPVEYDRIDDAADAAARRGDPVREGPSFLEILRQQRHRRHKHAACADPDADALRQHDLVVLGREARHHVAKDNHKPSEGEKGVKIARVKERSGNDAEKHEEESLDGSYPGDRRRGLVWQNLLFVVGLEYPESIDDAPLPAS